MTSNFDKHVSEAAAVTGVNASEFIRTVVLKAASELIEDYKKG